MHTNIYINVLGWMGAVLLLAAYWLVSTNRARGNGLGFQSLNIAGSAMLIANSAYYGALPSVGVNAFWILIAIVALVKRGRPERRQP